MNMLFLTTVATIFIEMSLVGGFLSYFLESYLMTIICAGLFGLSD